MHVLFQEFIELTNIKKCNTFGGNTFVLEEYSEFRAIAKDAIANNWFTVPADNRRFRSLEESATTTSLYFHYGKRITSFAWAAISFGQ